MPPKKLRPFLFLLLFLVMGGVGARVLAPSLGAARDALPLLRHAHIGWVAGAALCQCAMYAALAGILRAGLGAGNGRDTSAPVETPQAKVTFGYLWATGAAFLWTTRAMPLAGVATLTFLLNRRSVPAALSQAVLATFFLVDYVSFFGLGSLLFAVLAFQNRLTGLHPASLVAGMGLIVAGLGAFLFLLRVPDAVRRAAGKCGVFAARLLRRAAYTREKWGTNAQTGVGHFYQQWQGIMAQHQTLIVASLWAALMHTAEAATVFCAVCAFGVGGAAESPALLAQASGAGYATGNLAALVSFLPTGIGFFEGAMGTTLHYLGNVSVGQATLATLLYRLLSVWLPLPFVVGIARQALQKARREKETVTQATRQEPPA